MHPLHIVIGIVNAIFGLAFAVSILFHVNSPALLSFAVFGGYWFNALTLTISVVLLLMLVIHVLRGQATAFIHRHWLGLFNGVFIILFWLGVAGLDSLHKFPN